METVIKEWQAGTVEKWHWLKEDHGAWDGPHREWPEHSSFWYSYIKNFRTCVQAGGCQGMYPRLLSEKFEHVYTFEPSPDNYKVLQLNCADRQNIFHHNFALGSQNTQHVLNISARTNVGTHNIDKGLPINHPLEFSCHVVVDVRKLDDLDIEGPIDFMQLDVEGFEPEILRGAENVINTFKPAISCENGHREDLRQILSDHDYVVVGKTGADTLFIHKSNL